MKIYTSVDLSFELLDHVTCTFYLIMLLDPVAWSLIPLSLGLKNAIRHVGPVGIVSLSLYTCMRLLDQFLRIHYNPIFLPK